MFPWLRGLLSNWSYFSFNKSQMSTIWKTSLGISQHISFVLKPNLNFFNHTHQLERVKHQITNWNKRLHAVNDYKKETVTKIRLQNIFYQIYTRTNIQGYIPFTPRYTFEYFQEPRTTYQNKTLPVSPIRKFYLKVPTRK